MRTFLLTAILALALAPVASFAYETSNVDCDAYAETTERAGKNVKDKSENKDKTDEVRSN